MKKPPNDTLHSVKVNIHDNARIQSTVLIVSDRKRHIGDDNTFGCCKFDCGCDYICICHGDECDCFGDCWSM